MGELKWIVLQRATPHCPPKRPTHRRADGNAMCRNLSYRCSHPQLNQMCSKSLATKLFIMQKTGYVLNVHQ